MKWVDKFLKWLNNDEKETVTSAEGVKSPRRARTEGVFEIIIVSDNHGDTRSLYRVLEHQDEADFYLHCGDSNLPPDWDCTEPFIIVKGNTDYNDDYQLHEHLQLPTGENIWITHGHKEFVGMMPERIIHMARTSFLEKTPHIILYGHLHKVDVRMEEGFLIINPGSIMEPRDGIIKTYAKLTVSPDRYKIDIYDSADHDIIKEFQFPRPTAPKHQIPE